MSEERKGIDHHGRAGWLVVGSLALNLFLVGVVAGPMLGGPLHGPQHRMDEGRPFGPPDFQNHKPPLNGPGHGPGFLLDRVSQALPADEAAKFRAIFDDERKQMKDRRGAMLKTRAALAEALKQEKPDMDALHKALNEIQTAGQGFHEGMAHTMERVATELSPESRRIIADAMESEDRNDRPMPPPPSAGPMDGPPPAPPSMDGEEMKP